MFAPVPNYSDMRWSKWIGVLAFIVFVIVSFQPWIWVASKNITVTGMQGAGTNFGKPALLSLVLGTVAVVLFLLPYAGAKRANLFFCAFNLAWAIRNFILLSTCRQGDCPEKQSGLYLMLIASAVMMVASLFPDVKLKSVLNHDSGKE